MNNWSNIVILGSSHIAKESSHKVKQFINKNNPDIVAVELDANRLYGLLHKIKQPKNLSLVRKIGISGFVFYIIGDFIQKKLGKIVSVEPGAEMLTAFNTASKKNIPVALIDRDIRLTLREISKVRKREYLKIVIDIIKSFIGLGKFSFDLAKVPSKKLIEISIKYVKDNYPSLFKVLVDDRDRIMAKRLFKLSRDNPEKQIFCVVGAGHVKGIINYLTELSYSNT